MVQRHVPAAKPAAKPNSKLCQRPMSNVLCNSIISCFQAADAQTITLSVTYVYKQKTISRGLSRNRPDENNRPKQLSAWFHGSSFYRLVAIDTSSVHSIGEVGGARRSMNAKDGMLPRRSQPRCHGIVCAVPVVECTAQLQKILK